MTNTELLRDVIAKTGLKLSFIAASLSLSPYGLQNKINNVTEFKASEIATLCSILRITDPELRDAIFFARISDLKSTN